MTSEMSRRAKIALLVFVVLIGAYCWANDWPALYPPMVPR